MKVQQPPALSLTALHALCLALSSRFLAAAALDFYAHINFQTATPFFPIFSLTYKTTTAALSTHTHTLC